jgi:hypothetical protein
MVILDARQKFNQTRWRRSMCDKDDQVASDVAGDQYVFWSKWWMSGRDLKHRRPLIRLVSSHRTTGGGV